MILLILWRFTYGFRRTSHDLSLSFIARALGSREEVISRQITKLIDLNVIKVIGHKNGTNSRILEFCKDFDKWGIADLSRVDKAGKGDVDIEVKADLTEKSSDLLTDTSTKKNTKNINLYILLDI